MSVLARLLSASSPEELSISAMKRRDLREIMPIEQGAYPRPWSRTVFESELDRARAGDRHYIVARTGRELVGYAGLWFVADPAGDQAHVTNIVVAPERRRQGVGSRLMLELADVVVGRGCVAWTLEVRVSSTGAQDLYRRFGFAPAGVRRRYYENTEDAIVMWCEDIQTPGYSERLAELRRGAL